MMLCLDRNLIIQGLKGKNKSSILEANKYKFRFINKYINRSIIFVEFAPNYVTERIKSKSLFDFNLSRKL